ncbi:MAG TPA: ferritin family protein [Bacteroidales bacterium]|nr:ferritin family protein [Bacteroidales bacterium]
MKEFTSIEEILDFAIGEEQAAVDFYLQLAAQSTNSQTRKIFEEYAEEEMRHKANLVTVRENGHFTLPEAQVRDLKIAEYLVDVRPAPGMTYQDALILAMKKEKAAYRMYSKLAEKATDPEMKSLFLRLAQEESKHKLAFEIEYDDFILREN